MSERVGGVRLRGWGELAGELVEEGWEGLRGLVEEVGGVS